MTEPGTHGKAKAKLDELAQKYKGTEPFEGERPYIEQAINKRIGAGTVGGGVAGPSAVPRRHKVRYPKP